MQLGSLSNKCRGQRRHDGLDQWLLTCGSHGGPLTLSQGSHEAICIAEIYVMIYNSGYEVAKKTILWLGSHYSHIKGSEDQEAQEALA